MKVLLDLLAPPLLLLSAWTGARSWYGSKNEEHLALFLGSFLIGTAAGFRLAWSAFRWGRRRQGRDPQPAPTAPDDIVKPMLRFVGCSMGSLFCAFAGFLLWALATAFFRTI